MLRITSGIAKGRKLILPKNQKVTAVKEKVKLAIFSIIGDKITGAVCLDLYAGSGNLGIEALSRGASYCDFVDESKASVETIEKNLKSTEFTDMGNVIWDDVLKYLSNIENSYDIIFADPYYAETNQRHLLKLAVSKLNQNGFLYILSSPNTSTIELPSDVVDKVHQETRKYGKTLLTIISLKP
jgi:16S rRNA (guanine(966)-N(2))-methyltransferase RsmD